MSQRTHVMQNIVVITNNPTVPCAKDDVFLAGAGVTAVLERVRDEVHLGHRLLTHPFAGSVKPNENPYKSIVVTGRRFGVDYQSVQIIEGCLQTAHRMISERPYRNLPPHVLSDLALIDKSLLDSGLEALGEIRNRKGEC